MLNFHIKDEKNINKIVELHQGICYNQTKLNIYLSHMYMRGEYYGCD